MGLVLLMGFKMKRKESLRVYHAVIRCWNRRVTIGFMCERVPFVRRLAIASPATSRDGDLYHSHPHLQRTESHKRSFFNSSLQTAHDRIHIALLLDTSVSSSDGNATSGLEKLIRAC
jgi:hypothetical protein